MEILGLTFLASVTPDHEAQAAFLRDVLDLPEPPDGKRYQLVQEPAA